MFRKSEKTGLDKKQILTWICIAQMEATKLNLEMPFNYSKKDTLIPELRNIFNENANTLERVKETLNANGIKFLVCEKIKGTSID